MRIQDHSPSFCVLGAIFFLSPVARAQTSVGDTASGTMDASLRLPQQQDTDPAALDAPTKSFYFDEDEPRAFWRSQTGRRIVHPVTAYNYQDDAYITTDLRFNYLNHQFPTSDQQGVPDEGAIRTYDFQVRYAVNEVLQLQIYKAGYTDSHFQTPHELGTTDVAFALKFALLQDWANQTHVSIGLGYEVGVGHADVLAGDDEIRIFGAFNQGFDRSHFGASLNALFATGSEDDRGDSDRLSAHLHYDYEISDMFSPIAELNYYRVFSNGTPVSPISGLDLASFGGNEDEDALSAALGGELRLQRDLAVRIAYEAPLTDNNDLWGYRWTASAIWRF